MVLYICLMYEKLNAFRNVPHERIRSVALGFIKLKISFKDLLI
jgi:hypothetical protein